MGLEAADHGFKLLELHFAVGSLDTMDDLGDLSVDQLDLGVNLLLLAHQLEDLHASLVLPLAFLDLELELLDLHLGIGQRRDLVGTWVDRVDVVDAEGLEELLLDKLDVVAGYSMGCLT